VTYIVGDSDTEHFDAGCFYQVSFGNSIIRLSGSLAVCDQYCKLSNVRPSFAE